VHKRRQPRVVVLDMDSSESPTYGAQEGSAYNGHFGCTCYHPLFVFNQLGDLERCALRSGNVHSAASWREVLEPVVARYRDTVKRCCFRGDAAFANPEIYEFLEAEGMGYLSARRLYRHQPGAASGVAFDNHRGTCEQYIKEGKGAVKWTRLSCRSFAANAVRLQLHALAYNLGNFKRTLAMPKTAEPWSLTSLREKRIKIGAKVVSHGRYTTFQMAEVAVPRQMFQEILMLIAQLRAPPAPT